MKAYAKKDVTLIQTESTSTHSKGYVKVCRKGNLYDYSVSVTDVDGKILLVLSVYQEDSIFNQDKFIGFKDYESCTAFFKDWDLVESSAAGTNFNNPNIDIF